MAQPPRPKPCGLDPAVWSSSGVGPATYIHRAFFHPDRVTFQGRQLPARPAGPIGKREARHVARALDEARFHPAQTETGKLMRTQALKRQKLAAMTHKEDHGPVDNDLYRGLILDVRGSQDLDPQIVTARRHRMHPLINLCQKPSR